MEIPISEEFIALAGFTDEDNPISVAVKQQLTDTDLIVDMCLLNERLAFYRKGVGKIDELMTTTMLEDWYRDYIEGNRSEPAEPITLVIFQREDEVIDDEGNLDERFWIGIKNSE